MWRSSPSDAPFVPSEVMEARRRERTTYTSRATSPVVAHRVLVPFELPDAAPISAPLASDLAEMDVVTLGHFELPEQTPPEAGREQFLSDARDELTALTQPLVAEGADVTTRIVFGRARDKTINRVAREEGATAVFTPGTGATDGIGRVFVPLRGDANFEGVLGFAAELAQNTGASLTLFHEPEQSDRMPGEELLADAVDRLTAAGIDRDRIDTQLGRGDGGVRGEIVDRAGAYDVLVLGQTEPSLRERLLGVRAAGVTLDTDLPAFVVGVPGDGD